MAEWRTIEEYPGYKVSDDGQVFSVKRNRLLTCSNHINGYKTVLVTQNSKSNRLLAHRLVYKAFVGPIPSGYEVNHKDEDKGNNRLDNLELLTHWQNCNYGTRNQRMKQEKRKVVGRKVYQYTLDGILVRAWETMAEAQESGFWSGNVCACCKGRKPQYKGYHWSYN